MVINEEFVSGEPVWLVVQNQLRKGFVTTMGCDGSQVFVLIASSKSRAARGEATWQIPVDRVAHPGMPDTPIE